MAQGPQKPDHGGNFTMTPRRVTASVAWRETSFRARAVLQAFQHAHDGWNNGEIAFSIHEIGAAIGNQNHGANSRAVAELIEKGFIELAGDSCRAQSKARTYRITFIATGKARSIVPATHDYEAWRPVQKRKFGGARTATQNPVSGAVTASKVKLSGAVTATQETDLRTEPEFCSGAETASPLYNHISQRQPGLKISPASLQDSRAADLRADVDTLRTWANEVIQRQGYGGARKLAQAAAVPEPVLSRFRAGRSLPDHYRVPLQEACARHLPFNERKAA